MLDLLRDVCDNVGLLRDLCLIMVDLSDEINKVNGQILVGFICIQAQDQ